MNPVSDTTILDALSSWVEYDEVLDGLHSTWSATMDSTSRSGLDQAMTYLAQVGIIYTLAERARRIEAWRDQAGEDGRTPQEWATLDPDQAVMAEMNHAVTVQGIDRFFVYLYVHAHLLNVLNGGGPLSAMEEIRARIIGRPR